MVSLSFFYTNAALQWSGKKKKKQHTKQQPINTVLIDCRNVISAHIVASRKELYLSVSLGLSRLQPQETHTWHKAR